MNISFTALGHGECEQCESFKLHDHDQNDLQPDCSICNAFAIHKQKYSEARIQYNDHKENPLPDTFYYSADMEKVIMMPRMEMFKRNANSGRVVVEEMKQEDFYEWEDNSSTSKINRTVPRPYMKDMVEVVATRGKLTLSYRTRFTSDETHVMDFTKKKLTKKNIVKRPNSIPNLRGISTNRKSQITQNLLELMPENRRPFWVNLVENDKSADLRTTVDD
ncbi:hypothetical protein GE061_015411 [Apolygus lucorum]|uniref:Uncharacterized protein n=1 Tax=Apolygus lucorum TaxID=248454 RepID=A0A8S9XKW2_APOLU|nr:hypothetical protein GE061_015411 [Apolygus lucorum]